MIVSGRAAGCADTSRVAAQLSGFILRRPEHVHVRQARCIYARLVPLACMDAWKKAGAHQQHGGQWANASHAARCCEATHLSAGSTRVQEGSVLM